MSFSRINYYLRTLSPYMLFLNSALFSYSALGQPGIITGNEFNPAISVILDGRYTGYNDAFELPGFQLGGEAGIAEKGFGLGHSEVTLSANVDDLFYGYTALAVIEEEGATVLELEESYLETLMLGSGVTVKFGKFFSHIGYLNAIHDHAHDFTDVPLVYSSMVGNHLTDTGLQVRWVAPVDLYWESGIEITRGAGFPGGENEDNNNGLAVFSKLGGDLSISTSWLAGVSAYRSEFEERDGGHAHGHDGDEETHGAEYTNGEVDLYSIDFVFKWAPNGNAKQSYFKGQFEYFVREDNATVTLEEGADAFSSTYNGDLVGFYLQGTYQFTPGWRLGVRYDNIEPDNNFSNNNEAGIDFDEFLEDTELGADEAITRVSTMIDFSRSEFSRLRLQVNRVDNGETKDTQVMLQYLMSLGSHGAHKF